MTHQAKGRQQAICGAPLGVLNMPSEFAAHPGLQSEEGWQALGGQQCMVCGALLFLTAVQTSTIHNACFSVQRGIQGE